MKTEMENKRKHLQIIQGVINRMAGNLFFLKGWAITLIGALFALSAKELNANYFLISYYLIFVFWILDGYFLSQERLFRSHYDHVRQLKEEDIDFSMDTTKYRENEHNGWLRSMAASTLLWFYLTLIFINLVLIYCIKN